MKVCPFCAEEIQDAAIVCRYCGRGLSNKLLNYYQVTLTIHFRNEVEGGWLKAEGTPAVLAGDYFWKTLNPVLKCFDEAITKNGWLIDQPRSGECIKTELVWNTRGYSKTRTIASAVLTGGMSLIGQAFGYQKWWPSLLIYKWKKPYNVNIEEWYHIWAITQTMSKDEEKEQQKFKDFLKYEKIQIKNFN